MSEKSPPILIHVENPTFSGKGSIIILELADEAAALRVARKIADETGRGVTVRHADMGLIGTISAAKTH
ncbi:hypothetical protein [Bradyrhizobium sp. AUGA SZCCT0158]|uniref:hypothetical protein n=1 Tax=Bradyrhizobium sp. AUGA SZCCT0158 TaxID=2807661 RepID=UPI002013117A|nr:hypothetical protein [Bradyrhizobium sp. AUGA SZCCT0158]